MLSHSLQREMTLRFLRSVEEVGYYRPLHVMVPAPYRKYAPKNWPGYDPKRAETRWKMYIESVSPDLHMMMEDWNRHAKVLTGEARQDLLEIADNEAKRYGFKFPETTHIWSGICGAADFVCTEDEQLTTVYSDDYGSSYPLTGEFWHSGKLHNRVEIDYFYPDSQKSILYWKWYAIQPMKNSKRPLRSFIETVRSNLEDFRSDFRRNLKKQLYDQARSELDALRGQLRSELHAMLDRATDQEAQIFTFLADIRNGT